MQILKLPGFFNRLYDDVKSAAISKFALSLSTLSRYCSDCTVGFLVDNSTLLRIERLLLLRTLGKDDSKSHSFLNSVKSSTKKPSDLATENM